MNLCYSKKVSRLAVWCQVATREITSCLGLRSRSPSEFRVNKAKLTRREKAAVAHQLLSYWFRFKIMVGAQGLRTLDPLIKISCSGAGPMMLNRRIYPSHSHHLWLGRLRSRGPCDGRFGPIRAAALMQIAAPRGDENYCALAPKNPLSVKVGWYSHLPRLRPSVGLLPAEGSGINPALW